MDWEQVSVKEGFKLISHSWFGEASANFVGFSQGRFQVNLSQQIEVRSATSHCFSQGRFQVNLSHRYRA